MWSFTSGGRSLSRGGAAPSFAYAKKKSSSCCSAGPTTWHDGRMVVALLVSEFILIVAILALPLLERIE